VSEYSIGEMRLRICVSGHSIGEMLLALARGTFNRRREMNVFVEAVEVVVMTRIFSRKIR